MKTKKRRSFKKRKILRDHYLKGLLILKGAGKFVADPFLRGHIQISSCNFNIYLLNK
jgi:hypothetical protein